MKQAEKLQKTIFNNIPDQAWMKDIDSRYVLVNDAFVAASGLSEEQILNKTPEDIWPTDWSQQYMATDRKAISCGTRVRYEEPQSDEDGTVRWFDTIKAPIRDEGGFIIGTVGISRDITDRKQAEQELLESRNQLRELSGYLQSVREEERTRIARELHDELGQSLTAIRIGLSVIEEQMQSQQGDSLQSLNSLKKITESTVESVQRITADLRPLILDELGLISTIDWLLESFAQNSGITYEVSLPTDSLEFSPELRTAIFRVLQEALTNIMRHSQASHVVVQLQNDKRNVVLRITDNGNGIDFSDQREKSLGLVGMRERALMLGGKLLIHSEAGVGTSIEMRVPKA
jgi:two-component system sensor histidine kinase UhpB